MTGYNGQFSARSYIVYLHLSIFSCDKYTCPFLIKGNVFDFTSRVWRRDQFVARMSVPNLYRSRPIRCCQVSAIKVEGDLTARVLAVMVSSSRLAPTFHSLTAPSSLLDIRRSPSWLKATSMTDPV